MTKYWPWTMDQLPEGPKKIIGISWGGTRYPYGSEKICPYCNHFSEFECDDAPTGVSTETCSKCGTTYYRIVDCDQGWHGLEGPHRQNVTIKYNDGKYFVICPRCDTEHEVENKSSQELDCVTCEKQMRAMRPQDMW